MPPVAAALLAAGLVAGAPGASADSNTVKVVEGEIAYFKFKRPTRPSGQYIPHAIRYSYRVESGTAEAGKDFKNVSGKVTFATTVRTVLVKVPTLDDDEEEDAETFELILFNPEQTKKGKQGWYQASDWYLKQPKKTGWIIDW